MSLLRVRWLPCRRRGGRELIDRLRGHPATVDPMAEEHVLDGLRHEEVRSACFADAVFFYEYGENATFSRLYLNGDHNMVWDSEIQDAHEKFSSVGIRQ